MKKNIVFFIALSLCCPFVSMAVPCSDADPSGCPARGSGTSNTINNSDMNQDVTVTASKPQTYRPEVKLKVAEIDRDVTIKIDQKPLSEEDQRKVQQAKKKQAKQDKKKVKEQTKRNKEMDSSYIRDTDKFIEAYKKKAKELCKKS